MDLRSRNGNGGAYLIPPTPKVLTGQSLVHRQLDKRPRRIRQARSQFRNGERVAVVRAWTAAKLHRGEQIAPQSLAVASTLCGASLPYVAAMEVLLKVEDLGLLSRVFTGEVSLMDAANMVRKRAKLIEAFRKADPKDRIKAAEVIGAEFMFDEMIGPALDASPPADETLARWRAMQDEAV
jgi:hypothetical protein